MSSAIDQAFGIQARAMSVYAKRAEVIASNIANADTPNFKAKDVDFRAVLAEASQKADTGGAMIKTSAGHMDVNGVTGGMTLKYRTPLQSSLDGNTVNSEVEQANFAENSVKYQASYSFLNGTIKGLLTAIRGE
ncbi:MAG: flagellar basal body rod protein FlgB [Gammaproteobacteria bacterium]|nr:flagellar basal body rod protein FlgB [Gammaproteobacteria bacterium]